MVPALLCFRPVMQSRHLVLRAHCPNIYTMIKGLVPKSANLKCQSIAHNEESPATLATIVKGYDDTKYKKKLSK